MSDSSLPEPQASEITPRDPSSNPPLTRRQVVWEVLLVYLATLLAIKGVVLAQSGLGLWSDVLVVVPLLFMAVPIFWLEHLKEDTAQYGLLLEWRDLPPALLLNLKLFALILPVFLLANHMYQGVVMHKTPVGVLPNNYLTEVVAYHLFFVAFPEEFFYRGYMQSRLNRVFERPYRIFGVSFGPAMLWTTLLFTLGHSFVTLRWWHFAIMFPALLFGWIREKTGSVLAGALCHAACNILMVTLETWYGVIPA